QFFKKEWDPFGFFHDECSKALLHWTQHGGEHLAALLGREARQRDATVVGLARPGRDEFWPVRAHQQHADTSNVFKQKSEALFCGLIDPVQVFNDEDERTAGGALEHEHLQSLEDLALDYLG